MQRWPPPSRPTAPIDAHQIAKALCAKMETQLRRPLVVVPDHTRDVALATWMPPLVDELLARGALKVRVVFASGTHRPMTPSVRRARFGDVPWARVEHEAHDCDADDLVDLGGGPLHRFVAEADALFVISGLSMHYLAGVGGGRKMLVPGVASRAAATAVHATTITQAGPGRAAGIGPGLLRDNPMHLALMERLARMRLPTAAMLLVEMGEKGVTQVHVAHDMGPSFESLAEEFVARQTVMVEQPLDAVLTTTSEETGGDLVQAHKALVALRPVVRPLGRIVVACSLQRGFGNDAMEQWLSMSSSALLAGLRENFSIGMQTAWSLRQLLDTFEIGVVGVSPLRHAPLAAAGFVIVDPAQTDAWLSAAGPRVATAAHASRYRYCLKPRT